MKLTDLHVQENGTVYISDSKPMTVDRLIESLQTIRDHIGSDFEVAFFGSIDRDDSDLIADCFADGKERVHLVMPCCTVLHNPTAEEGNASHNVILVANSSVVNASDHEKGDNENED